MNKNQVIKSLLMLSMLPLSAIAEDQKPVSKKDYYFATVKIGMDQPIARGGNTDIDSADTTYNAGVEFGKKIMEIYGLSFEYKKIGNSNFTISKGVVDSYSATWSGKSDVFMLNASADVIKNSLVTPYVKFGLGASVNRASDYVLTSQNGLLRRVHSGTTNTQFAWQIGLGLNVTSNELFDIDMGYMFLDRGQFTTHKGYVGTIFSDPNAAAQTTNLRDHTVTIGLKAKF